MVAKSDRERSHGIELGSLLFSSTPPLDYISHGMRERAAEIVAFDLGPKSDAAIESQLKREVEQERFTRARTH